MGKNIEKEIKANKIILIMTDTQRKDYLGCYGNKDMDTPYLDKLARQGMKFEQAYCTQPVCGPTRTAIFTGEYPHLNGSWANSMAVNKLTKNIGERMEEKGFHTAYIGKWHLSGGDYFDYGECPPGWDEDYWFDMRCYLEEMSREDRLRSRDPTTIYDNDFDEEFTYGHKVSSRAVEFLENHHEENFMLVVSYDEPHGPALAPPGFIKKYKDYKFPLSNNVTDDLENKPDHHTVWAGDRLAQDFSQLAKEGIECSQRLGCNSFVDYEIGRVMETVDHYTPGALVFYLSDHGEALYNHRLSGKGPAMYEEITNVPLIVRWPEVVPEGTICEHPVSHIDIAPTILKAAGLDIPNPLQGNSFLSALQDPKEKPQEEIFLEFSRYEIDHDGFGGFQPIRCIYDGRYKLVINLLSGDELYDLNDDPKEMNNLINNNSWREIRNDLHDRLLDWMNETRDPFRGYYWERRPWRKDSRPATWDYTGMTRQRKPDEGEKRQLDYRTGLEMEQATREN